MAQTVPFGPYGGTGGQQWDDGKYSTIREIVIYSSNIQEINSIQVIYDDDGKAVSKNKHGSRPGNFLHKVTLDHPTEYLISMSGCHSRNYKVVNSITFQSNKRQYGPYGSTQGGTRFVSSLTGGKIVGFFGRSADVLNSIGVYIKPIQTKIPVGPFGTTGGLQWDDGIYSTVRELIIHSGAVIDSIQVVYDNEGKRVLGERHGSDGGAKATVTLDYPDEFLVSVWGYYGQVDKMVIIRSLGFQSNKRTFGPFGVEDGEKFQFPSSTCAKIIGFHGRSDKYLNAIGAYLDK